MSVLLQNFSVLRVLKLEGWPLTLMSLLSKCWQQLQTTLMTYVTMYMFKSGLFEGIRKQPVNGETSAKIICYYHLSRASHEPKLLCCSLGEGPNGDVNQLLCKADERGRYPGLPLERAFCCIGQRTPELLHSEKDFKWNMYEHVCVSVLLSIQHIQLQLQLDFVPVCLFLLFGTMASRCSQICWTNTFGACAPA